MNEALRQEVLAVDGVTDVIENLRRNTEKKCRIHNAGVAGCAEALLIPAE